MNPHGNSWFHMIFGSKFLISLGWHGPPMPHIPSDGQLQSHVSEGPQLQHESPKFPGKSPSERRTTIFDSKTPEQHTILKIFPFVVVGYYGVLVFPVPIFPIHMCILFFQFFPKQPPFFGTCFRSLPGPLQGRDWVEQRKEKLLEAPKAGKTGFDLGKIWKTNIARMYFPMNS